jgi:hypothetical protein
MVFHYLPGEVGEKNEIAMRVGYRAGLIGLLSGLLFCLPVAAQVADTERVGQEADTAQVTKDTTSSFSNHTDDSMVLRSIPDSVIGAAQKDEAFAYANDPAYWRQQRRDTGPNWLATLLFSRGFEIFLLCLLGAILLYAIIRIIAENNLQFFYRSPRRQPSAASAEVPDLLEDDLEGKLQHFLQTKEYRQAVRYLYLKSLRLLNERGLIRYQNHQPVTNWEYWQQLNGKPQSAPFRDLTVAYEKVWYGEFPVGDSQFERLHRYFEDFYKTVRA